MNDPEKELIEFARSIENVLKETPNLGYHRSQKNDAFIFQIKTIPAVRMKVFVHGEQFSIVCNEAEVRVDRYDDRQASNPFEAWHDDAIAYLRALLAHDLCLRVRRTFFGNRVGAIWIEGFRGEIGGAWCGELGAIRGKGKEFVYRDWLQYAENKQGGV